MLTGTFIKLTESCSAGCSHCPFASETPAHVPVQKVIDKINASPQPLIVLSGGEPLEHPDLNTIIGKTSLMTDKIFRIATGSHIPLQDYIESIKNTGNMTGVSLGTDVLFQSRNSNGHSEQFWKNVDVLGNAEINYSITLTLGSDIKWQEVEHILNDERLSPTFFLVQYRDDEKADQSFVERVSEKIQTNFPKKVIHYANLG